MEGQNKVRKNVEKILSENENTRNFDKDLIWKYWEYEGTVINGAMSASAWYKSTSAMTISRARREIQHDGKYLPTRENVVKERRINQKKWRNARSKEIQPELF